MAHYDYMLSTYALIVFIITIVYNLIFFQTQKILLCHLLNPDSMQGGVRRNLSLNILHKEHKNSSPPF